MIRNPLFSKILMICLLALLLLIPLSMIKSKIIERQSSLAQVQQDIARSASGPQTLSGPYLVIRYKLKRQKTIKDGRGNERIIFPESNILQQVISPHVLKIDAEADVETRSRGIYKARMFNLRSQLSGYFEVPKGYGIDQPIADIIPVDAFFVVNVSDSRGIQNTPVLKINGSDFEFSPGSISPINGNGIHAAIGTLDVMKAQDIDFEFPLELQGMSTLAVSPSGNTTEMSLSSAWPHPSFGGNYLPRSRTVDNTGFTAQWLVTNLARNNLPEGIENAAFKEKFSIDFINPVNVYLLSERAVKYGVLFVVLVFTSFFVFEMLRDLRIHPMQYLLVGLAMAMFFLLIISLSEHMPFLAAYMVSGTACAALIGVYLAGVLKSHKPALAFSGGIMLLYAILYGVLQSEDNALLMGTLVMFSSLSAMMALTRHMDWYGLDKKVTVA